MQGDFFNEIFYKGNFPLEFLLSHETVRAAPGGCIVSWDGGEIFLSNDGDWLIRNDDGTLGRWEREQEQLL